MSSKSERYNEIYRSGGLCDSEAGYDPVVVRAIRHADVGSALDIGAGVGRHALLAATCGFSVTAIDNSDVAIEILRRRALSGDLSLSARVGDIETCELSGSNRLVIATFVLHHLKRAKALSVVERLQQKTILGGVHAVATFTKEGDFFHERAGKDFFFPDESELRLIYKGWAIGRYWESAGPAYAKKANGQPMNNTVARFIATKIAQ